MVWGKVRIGGPQRMHSGQWATDLEVQRYGSGSFWASDVAQIIAVTLLGRHVSAHAHTVVTSLPARLSACPLGVKFIGPVKDLSSGPCKTRQGAALWLSAMAWAF